MWFNRLLIRRSLTCALVALAVVLLLAPAVPVARAQAPTHRQSAPAADLAHLDEFPAPRDVVRGLKPGRDRKDTVARQAAVLYRLRWMVENMAGGRQYRGQLTDRETNLIAVYSETRGNVIRTVVPQGQTDYEFNRLDLGYQTDKALEAEMLEQFFSPRWRERFARRIHGEDLPRLAPDGTLQPGGADTRRLKDGEFVLAAAWPAAYVAEFVYEKTGQDFRQQLDLVRKVLIGVAGLLALLSVIVAWRRPRLNSSDAFQLRVGGRFYRLAHSTGVAYSVSKGVENVTHVSTDQNYHVSSSTSRTVYDRFFIQQSDGHHQSVTLRDFDANLAEGHMVSVVWPLKAGRTPMAYILFYNHVIGRWVFDRAYVKKMLKPRLWPVFFLLLLTPIAPTENPLADGGWFTMLLLFIAYLVLRSITASIRATRFKNKFVPRLTSALRDRAAPLQNSIGIPGGGRISQA